MSKLDGLGLWTWILSKTGNGNPAAAVALAKEMGARRVYLKVADGTAPQNAKLAGPFARAFVAAGIEVWGWAFLYDKDPINQARSLIRNARAAAGSDLSGVIVNIEKHYADEAKKDADTLRILLAETIDKAAGATVGVSSYGRLNYFPDWPWHVLSEFASQIVGMPQIYGFKSPAHAAARVRTAWTNYRRLGIERIVPTIGAFVNDSMDHSPAEIAAAIEECAGLSSSGVARVDAWTIQHIEGHPHMRGVVEELAKVASVKAPSGWARPKLLDARLSEADVWTRRAALNLLGHYRGRLFYAEPAWADAVKAFQTANGLKVDGVWGSKTHIMAVSALAKRGL